MDNSMESMLDVYLFEANDLLEHLDEILINCEKQNSFDTDSINEIFRIMHTIKGSSAMMQFNSLTTISHKVEDLFFYVRDKGIDSQYYSDLFDLMFKSSDFIKAEVEKVQNNEPLTTDIDTFEQEINDFLKKISSGSAGSDEKPSAPAAKAPEAPAAPSAAPAAQQAAASVAAIATTAEQENFVKAEAKKGFPYALKVTFDEEAQMENLRAFMLVNSITDVYPDIEYYPQDIQTNSETVEQINKDGFLIAFKEKSGMDSALRVIETFIYAKNYTILSQENSVQEAAQDPKAENSNAPAAAPQPHQVVKQNLINVNLSRLDSLMDLMGEIVITESMVTSAPRAQQDGAADNNFNKASRQLRKLTDELQEIVMSIRMVPISGVFQKMNRIVRDMSKKLDKDVQLVLVGEETEVDKTIVDSISDPIMHLVRNCMDHGIETKEDRAKTNKPAKGTVTLSAQNTGGEILVTVEDDGGGIDREGVLRKAKKQGMLTKPENEYTNKEVNNFILMPGFSTNEVVTEYSGRGVGMDVVKKNVEKIGGDVSLTSELGKGTKIVFKIPLTLAIVNGMKVSVGDTMFTVPISNIKQSFKVSKENVIYDTDKREIIMVRNEYYPVIRLHETFEVPTKITDISEGIVLLVETHEASYCIFADALLGEQQVVVKPLPAYLSGYDVKESGISGCAILGDGSISLILDIQNLYNSN
ncbi:MAG TPA: chemotaxis protein CheA [Oscillospiraceae bacterium]|nr:chemotaxis protein CheA [Oscillospiraceae bacterium]